MTILDPSGTDEGVCSREQELYGKATGQEFSLNRELSGLLA
jgi:hypothetical protein